MSRVLEIFLRCSRALSSGSSLHSSFVGGFGGRKKKEKGKGRKRKIERRKERRWRSSRASPASPGTCPGQQLQLLLWRKSQLSLAASHLPRGSLPPTPLPSPLPPGCPLTHTNTHTHLLSFISLPRLSKLAYWEKKKKRRLL